MYLTLFTLLTNRTYEQESYAGIYGEVQDDMTVGRRVSELTMGWF